MDKGTNARDVLEGRSYRLRNPWVGIVNRSQADINNNADMIAARRKEREFFATSPEYSHLASQMGSEYLAGILSEHLESVIRTRIPGITSLINKSIDELEAELADLGRPVAVDAGAQLYTILELCRDFERVFKEHLDGEADGYQTHLIAPELGYRRLLESSLGYFKGPAQGSVDAVHFVLKELVRKSIAETQELKRFPTLPAEIAAAANEALDRFREDGRKTTLRLVEMESSYITVDFFRKLPQEVDQGRNPSASSVDQDAEGHFQRISSNVSSYIGMVSEILRNTIPKAVVHCQVREAKRSLLDHFYAQLVKTEERQLAQLLGEDSVLSERRQQCAKRLELYRSARDEIEAVSL